MAATYDSSLPTSKDKVRVYISDTDTSTPRYSDEEIIALLTQKVDELGCPEQCAAYFVSADLIRSIMTKQGFTGDGVNMQQVDDLRVEFGGRMSTFEQLLVVASTLEQSGKTCCRRSAKRIMLFKVA